MGSGAYMNFGCLLLDGNTIEIGDDTLIGPNVQFYPPGTGEPHP
jgi:maltose O-acetyltransferase